MSERLITCGNPHFSNDHIMARSCRNLTLTLAFLLRSGDIACPHFAATSDMAYEMELLGLDALLSTTFVASTMAVPLSHFLEHQGKLKGGHRREFETGP